MPVGVPGVVAGGALADFAESPERAEVEERPDLEEETEAREDIEALCLIEGTARVAEGEGGTMEDEESELAVSGIPAGKTVL